MWRWVGHVYKQCKIGWGNSSRTCFLLLYQYLPVFFHFLLWFCFYSSSPSSVFSRRIQPPSETGPSSKSRILVFPFWFPFSLQCSTRLLIFVPSIHTSTHTEHTHKEKMAEPAAPPTEPKQEVEHINLKVKAPVTSPSPSYLRNLRVLIIMGIRTAVKSSSKLKGRLI